MLQELLKTVDVCEPKLRFLQVNGESLLAKMPAESTVALRQSLETLNVRWDNIQSSINGRRSQLDEALKMADSFQDTLSRVMTWLNDVEQTVNSLTPVSRVLSTLTEQRQELKVVDVDCCYCGAVDLSQPMPCIALSTVNHAVVVALHRDTQRHRQ